MRALSLPIRACCAFERGRRQLILTRLILEKQLGTTLDNVFVDFDLWHLLFAKRAPMGRLAIGVLMLDHETSLAEDIPNILLE